jgi:hypothetical protein
MTCLGLKLAQSRVAHALPWHISPIVVRAPILRCRARYAGTLGFASATGNHWTVWSFSKSHVHWRIDDSGWLVRPLGFAHSCDLHRSISVWFSASRSVVRRVLGGPPIRSAVAGIPGARTSVADLTCACLERSVVQVRKGITYARMLRR